MRALSLTALLTAGALALTGCGESVVKRDAAPDPTAEPSAEPQSQVVVGGNVRAKDRDVPVSRFVKLTADQGRLTMVNVTTAKGTPVPGRFNRGQTRWEATSRLEPNTGYRVETAAEDSDGLGKEQSFRFRSEDLSLDEQTYPSMSPLDGQTVGVGFPVMIHFDVPVKNRAKFEKHMHVKSSAGQKGSFHWLDSQNVHYRPRSYWKPGSTVKVRLDVNSLPAGAGIYGQEDRKATFRVARAMVSTVNIASHQMEVRRNGQLLRTLPITTGKPGFTTRSGTKVIIEKYDVKRMNSETVGISRNDPEAYDIDDVQWAMRVTYSGEFLHSAPWSVGSQGYANVSHGCTGLSPSNAKWLYDNSIPGDVVKYVGSNRYMTLTNGYGDWNLSWDDWKAGSAL